MTSTTQCFAHFHSLFFILSDHGSHPPGDILIFMTGQEDIEATCFVLADRIRAIGEGVPPLVILPIYSQLAADQQAKVRAARRARRRVNAR